MIESRTVVNQLAATLEITLYTKLHNEIGLKEVIYLASLAIGRRAKNV